MNNLVEIKNNQVITSSRKVAEVFGKQHAHIIRNIERLIKDGEGLSKNGDTPSNKVESMIKGLFGESIFKPMHEFVNPMNSCFYKTSYINEQNGEEYLEYLINSKGFTLLCMGFTGSKFLAWKIAYIDAFDAMKEKLLEQNREPKYMELPPIEIANNRPGRMRRKKVGMEILTCVMAVLEANRASMIQKQIWFRNLAKQFGLNPTDREIYQLEKEIAEQEETMKVTLEFPIKRTIELKGKK